MAPVTKRTKLDDECQEEEHPSTTLFRSVHHDNISHQQPTKSVTFCSREYLRIKSVQPDPDYDSCNEFLTRQAQRLGLDYHITEMVKGKPIFIMTWPGTEPDLPSVLLNSHTDVVPVYEGK